VNGVRLAATSGATALVLGPGTRTYGVHAEAYQGIGVRLEGTAAMPAVMSASSANGEIAVDAPGHGILENVTLIGAVGARGHAGGSLDIRGGGIAAFTGVTAAAPRITGTAITFAEPGHPGASGSPVGVEARCYGPDAADAGIEIVNATVGAREQASATGVRASGGGGDGASCDAVDVVHGRRDIGEFEYRFSRPTLMATGTPVSVYAHSYDADPGDPLEYLWTQPDGGTSTEENFERTFAAPGRYAFHLEVTDPTGQVAEATLLLAWSGRCSLTCASGPRTSGHRAVAPIRVELRSCSGRGPTTRSTSGSTGRRAARAESGSGRSACREASTTRRSRRRDTAAGSRSRSTAVSSIGSARACTGSRPRGAGSARRHLPGSG